jgi:hypothetical protein
MSKKSLLNSFIINPTGIKMRINIVANIIGLQTIAKNMLIFNHTNFMGVNNGSANKAQRTKNNPVNKIINPKLP